MTELRKAAEQVLDALEELMGWQTLAPADAQRAAHKSITELRHALKQPQCNPHPQAPHGFDRNASHSADRYVCDCERWNAYDAGYQAGVQEGLEQQQPVPVVEASAKAEGGAA